MDISGSKSGKLKAINSPPVSFRRRRVQFKQTGADTKKILGLFLILALAACAPSKAAIEHAIAQTQTAEANGGQFETPPPVEETDIPVFETATPILDQGVPLTPPGSGPAGSNPDQGTATSIPGFETASPIPGQEEATSLPGEETATLLPGETEIPATEVTDVPGETATLLPAAVLDALPPKTAAPVAKDSGSGLVVVAILFLVGIFAQFGKKGDKSP